MTNTSTATFRKQRIREVNSRLNSLKPINVRNYLLTQGFYPEEQFIPSDFFNSSDLVSAPKMTKYLYNKGVFTPKNIPKNNSAQTLYYPKTHLAKMTMAIPPVENYLYLTFWIECNWKFLKSHLLLNPNKDLIIPYSYPLFYDKEKRSDITINNFKQFYEFDIRSFAHLYQNLIFVDIKNFYPSIYTHAIAWALNENTRKEKYQKDLRLIANQFDLLLRRLEDNKSKGIPIGPVVSDIAAEVLLRKVDYLFSKKMSDSREKFIGGRFKDDYIFLCDSLDLAQKIVSQLQNILGNFDLDINESKTNIIQGFFEEDSKLWKIETDVLKNEIKESRQTKESFISYEEHKLSLWLRKTKDLYKKYGDQYIINSVLGILVNPKLGVEGIHIDATPSSNVPYKRVVVQLYIAVLNNILDLCRSSPRSWPYFFVFAAACIQAGNPHYKLIIDKIKEYLELLLLEFVNNNFDFPLIWGLYIFWRSELTLNPKTKKLIEKKYKNNWLVLSFFSKSASLHKVQGVTYKLVTDDRKKPKKLFELVSVFTYRDIGS